MMKREKFPIANIYVPIKRRATLKPEIVQEIAQSILEIGQQMPILVRQDGDRGIGRRDDRRISARADEVIE